MTTNGRAAAHRRDRHVVVISRDWDNPQIQISVTNVRIAVAMKLPAYLEALSHELGADAALKKRLLTAADVVCEKMKRETARVI